MDYELAIDGSPDTIPGGTGVLLLHPSTGETDRIDTDFLKKDTDRFLVISTRTTAREVMQKLDYYGVAEQDSAARQTESDGVDADRAVVLDTLSVDRGYSRRSSDNVHYVGAPDDLDGIVRQTENFLADHDGKLRVSLDSITELAYYAGEEPTMDAIRAILALLDDHDAVGLFHLSNEVHSDDVVESYRELFDGVIDLDQDGSVTADF